MVWWLWLAGGLLLLLIELVTPSGFFVMFFGLGALTAGMVAAVGLLDTALAQWLTFVASSLAYLVLFRGRLQRRVDDRTGGVDTLVGEIATPRERIHPGELGRVDLRGALWTARNDAATFVETGQRCRVTRVDGLIVGVEPE